MGKLSRKERKEEEKRIIAELDAAMAENKAKEEGGSEQTDEKTAKKPSKSSFYDQTTPEKIHCKRCKTLMENGVCPTCGFRVYVPMEQGKRDKIRLWVTVGLIAVFLVMFLILQIKNG